MEKNALSINNKYVQVERLVIMKVVLRRPDAHKLRPARLLKK